MGAQRGACAAVAACLLAVPASEAADAKAVEALRAAYLQRKDWDALIRLEEERPEAERSAVDRSRLASWYYRKGRYADASALLERLVKERPEDAEIVRLAGITLFNLGEQERALPRLESALSRLSGPGAAEVATLLGLIHFRKGELPQAEQALRRAVQLAPQYSPAYGALGRVLAAKGDATGAQEQLARSEALRARTAAEEGRAMRLSARSQLASQAVQERRWDDCERIVAEMLPEADQQLRVRLYRYLAEVRTAAGRGAAAQEARRKAEDLAREAPRP